MSPVQVWTVDGPLGTKPSRDLVELCCALSATFCVVMDFAIRELDQRWPESYSKALLGLAPFYLRTTMTTTWPGSTSVDPVERLEYGVSDGLVHAIASVGLPVKEWGYPLAPDDPHFLRQDGSTLLGSCTSEDALWLELREAEATPTLVERLERIGFTPDGSER